MSCSFRSSSVYGRIRTIACLIVIASLAGAAAQAESSDYATLTAQIAELRAEVSSLNDRMQIHDVYVRYMRGFDRNDVELMRSAFWPEVQINYGTQSNTFNEFVAKHLKLHTEQLAAWGHLITNEAVDIEGDVAHVEVYVTALWMPKDEKSFAYGRPIVGGRYIDRLDRRNGEWRIAVREFVPHFQIKAYTDFSAWDSNLNKRNSQCAMGTLDRRDPSYLRPLNPRTAKDAGVACAE